MQETWVQSLGQKDPLEKEMATYSSILTWEIPWTEEPGGLQSMGSQRVGHDLATKQQQQQIHICNKSLKENTVIWKTHFVVAVTFEKVWGGIIVERSKQLLMFPKLNGEYTTIYIVTFILWRFILYYCHFSESWPEGQARSNTLLKGWNYPFVLSFLFLCQSATSIY